MERQIITVDIVPGAGQLQRLKMAQGDIGRPLGVYVMRGGVALDCSAYTADLYVLKPDGNYYTITATVDTTKTNLIYWDTGEQETPVAGDCAAQIRITQNGDDIGTARFVEFVEASPGFVGEASQSVVESLMEYVREAAASAQTATDAKTAAQTAQGKAEDAQTAAETAQGKAEDAQDAAEDAKDAAEDAAEAAEDVKDYLDLHYTDLADDVTDLKTALSDETYNLFDLEKITGDGITINGEVVTGTAASFYSAFGESKGGVPLGIAFDANSGYIFSGTAKNLGSSTSGNGVTFGFHYTDGTNTRVAVPNSATSDYVFGVTADIAKTISFVFISYSSVGENTWQLSELSLVKSRVSKGYASHIEADDSTARNAVYQLALNTEAADLNAIATLTNKYDIPTDCFELGNIAIGSTYFTYHQSTSRVRNKANFPVKLKANTVITLTSGVFYIGYFDSTGAHYAGWVTTYTTPIDADYYIVMRYNPESTVSDIDSLLSGLTVKPPKNVAVAGIINNISKALDVLKLNKFYGHLLLNKINGNNVVIPLQSIPSIYMSKRLGFCVIEANVRKTSDDQYIVTHGTNGAFGEMFEHTDGSTDISGVLINSVTMAWIKENVRYKSVYGKYRTSPPTLQEYLSVCKELGMIPLVQISNDENVVSIVNEIMGKDNYIAYNSTRDLNSGFIMNVRNYTTKTEIVNECESIGNPFIYFMANPSSFSDSDLADIISTLHSLGYTIGFQDTYISEQDASKYIQMGFDICATTWNINDIDCGNEWNVSGDISYSDFETTGTVNSDGNLFLSNGQYVRKWGATQKFLVGQVVYVRFNGTLTVNMSGNFRSGTYTSDGSEYVRISCGALNGYAEFMLTSVGETEIFELTGKASIF